MKVGDDEGGEYKDFPGTFDSTYSLFIKLRRLFMMYNSCNSAFVKVRQYYTQGYNLFPLVLSTPGCRILNSDYNGNNFSLGNPCFASVLPIFPRPILESGLETNMEQVPRRQRLVILGVAGETVSIVQ